MENRVLLIACGALAKELVEIQKRNDWSHLKIQCLPADLHHTPARIPGAVVAAIDRYGKDYENIFVAYADCGTSGMLDRALEAYKVERLPGAHCYEWFAGERNFAEICEAEPGTFFLTDFLVRHFDRLVVQSLGIDRHPELKALYFGNYKRVVYLAQTASDELSAKARNHAAFLGLDYEHRHTGLERVASSLQEHVVRWQN